VSNKEANQPRKRPRKVKVFGERNTGTRAVMKMLRNLKGVSISSPHPKQPDLEQLGELVRETCTGFARELYRDALEDERRRRFGAISAWKHAAPVVDASYAEKNVSVLFLVRDPYSWILSLTKRPYHSRAPKLDSVSEFLRRPWLCLHRDNMAAPVLRSPMILWNEKLRAYQEFARQAPVPSAVLHFEDFVLDPVGALGGALQPFGIEPEGLVEIGEPTKTGGLETSERYAYYANERWKSGLTPEAASLVNELVDWDVATHFGYKKREPAGFLAR